MADIQAFFSKEIDSAKSLYTSDLEAMSEEQLASSPGGVARTPFDVTYEVVYVNRRIVKRLKGEDPGAFPEGWLKAPDDFKTKAAAVRELQQSMDEVKAEWERLPSSDLEKPIATQGSDTNPLSMVHLCVIHAMYHDAQLNYLQAIMGDAEMHWK